jgi:selenocysteine-specific elongation factor
VRHLVLGTAGHIDHGKSALVLALTGIDPDRLDEEKRRGITIDLGFADVELNPGRVLSFVDVPGHERFVRHMVSGAAGIDAVMLVIAADQGIQPQTREHLAICNLLGLRRGVVALTKCDLVERDLREVAVLEIRELLAGGFLQDAPVVQVSARSGEGLEELRLALSELFDDSPPRPAAGIARLPVDRSFVLRGFGAVVTGSLLSGTLREGDEVEILPGGRRARIRGLQVHHSRVDEAKAGRRTAVNLQGIYQDDVRRGDSVSHPGTLMVSRRIWARLRLLPGAPAALAEGGRVRFHQGTCERSARFRVLGRGEGGGLHVEIRLDRDTVLVPGDRFIIRRPAPVDTVGGGIVMEVDPPRAKSAVASDFAPESLEAGEAVRRRLSRAGGAGREPAGLARELGLTAGQAEEVASRLEESGELIRAGSRWLDGDAWRAIGERALHLVAQFHSDEPLLSGMFREDLRAATCREMTQEAWRQLLEGLEAGGALSLLGERVALADHEIALSGAERELAERIEGAFRRAGLEPPDLDEAVTADERKQASKIAELLVAGGKLVRIRGGKLFHAEALDSLRAKLRDHAKHSRTIDVPAFKKLAGITRKNAIPLLEQFDEERTTRREGNLRIILAPRNDGEA